MKKHELSYGFSPEDTEEEIRQKYGDEAAQLFIEQRRKTAHWTQKKWDDFNARYEKLAQKFAYARDKGLKPESKEVQKLVKEHHSLLSDLFHPSKLFCDVLANLYLNHPQFRKFFKSFHEDLPEFIVEAMNIYADAGANIG